MSEKRKCEQRVYKGVLYSHACPNFAKVERQGKWYCGVHDPLAVQEKQEARSEKRRAEWDAQHKSWAAQKRRAEAGEMGIELARYILSPGAIFFSDVVAKAQAVLDKLESEETCQRKA